MLQNKKKRPGGVAGRWSAAVERRRSHTTKRNLPLLRLLIPKLALECNF